MKIYPKLMEYHNARFEDWPLFADVTCSECEKVQSLANYRSNNSKCVKCNNHG
jgi:PHP family Zn ribbon phosphoesterase